MRQIAVFHRTEGGAVSQIRQKLMSKPHPSVQNPHSRRSVDGLWSSICHSRVKPIPSLMIGAHLAPIISEAGKVVNLGDFD